MKRRTRRQWYQYHQQKAEDAEKAIVVSRFADAITRAEQAVADAVTQIERALKLEPRWSTFLSIFGIDTAYRRTNVEPLRYQLNERRALLNSITERRRVELIAAIHEGRANYNEAHAERQEELIARQERVAERAHERRIRYLERSPSIRSAARFLKSILIKQHANDTEYVICFYCGVELRASESHLEHKRPISRGGDNRRSNLVLSCPSCNLKKGRKTHEEFIRSRNNGDL